MRTGHIFHCLAACIALVLSAPALADSAYSGDVSDLWWNPSESGWGLNLVQQGSVVFATLYVYGPDGRPRWYSASDMEAIGLGASGRDPSFTGTLYETTGPTSLTAFDPSQVMIRAVGSLTFIQQTTTSALLRYTVDGVSVSKTIFRFTWRINDISGHFNTSRVSLGYNCAPSSPVTETLGPTTVAQSGSSITITTAGGMPSNTCVYSGTYSQGGRMGLIQGSYTCNDGTSGSFRMEEVEVNPHAFSAYYQAVANNCQVRGHFGGVRTDVRPPPD